MAGTRFVLTLILVLTVLVTLSQPEEDGTHTPSTDESGTNVTGGCVEALLDSSHSTIYSRSFYNFAESERSISPESLLVRVVFTPREREIFCLLFSVLLLFYREV